MTPRPPLRALAATLALAAALTLALAGAAPDAAAKPKVRTYTVQPGDSIWSIATEFYGSGDKYKLIYQYNTFIGAPPFILKPGQVLTLPEGEVSPEAQVDWMREEVKAKPPRALDWLSASTKMNLWKLYQVSTGDESAVHIVFEDDSDLRLGDNALLVIYGGSSKSAAAKKQQEEPEKTQVLLKEGTVRGGLSALDDKPKKPMVIETPAGIVELQSQLAQIQASAAMAIVSVYAGQAAVKSNGQTVKVEKGYGTVVEKGKAPEKPTPLPPPPGWGVGGDGTAVAVVPAGGRATFEATWTAVTAAKTYRVELAQDEAFKQSIVNVLVDSKTTRFALDQIPVGRYFARVAARDGRGLEGMPTSALPIDVVGVRASRRMSQDESGQWQVVGLVRLDLGDVGPGLEWSLNDGPWLAGTEPARVQGAGPASVRVRRAGQSLATTFGFRVLAVSGALDVGPATPLAAGDGAPRVVTLTVSDELGRPAALPEVVLTATPGGPLALTEAGPGRWTAVVPAPAPPGPPEIALAATWPDGELARGVIAVDQKLPPAPYVYAWREGLTGLPWDGRRATTPLPDVVPIDRIGAHAAIVYRAGATYAGLTLAGEVGLAGGALGLDGALTLMRPPLTDDAPQLNEVGDLVVGARYQVFTTRRFALAPSLRLRVPLRDRDGDRVWGLEPSLLLRWRAAREAWLESRQGVFAGLGDGGDTTYVGDYAAVWRPLDLVSLQAQLATAFDLGSDAADAVALGAGLGAHLHLGRVRLGLVVGLGLGDGGRARFGAAAGQLTLDFGLGTP